MQKFRTPKGATMQTSECKQAFLGAKQEQKVHVGCKIAPEKVLLVLHLGCKLEPSFLSVFNKVFVCLFVCFFVFQKILFAFEALFYSSFSS